LLRALLAEAVSAVVTGDAVALPLLRRFPAVVVLDSTTIALPVALVDHWHVCSNGRGASAAARKV
jgi:hypothetical protein